MKYEELFTPISIGAITLKNRLIAGPATMCYAEADGQINNRLVEFYRHKAAGGIGMVIVEGAYISPEAQGYQGQINIANDVMLKGLTRLATSIKEGGARASIQIQHCGRRAKSVLTGLQPLAPSAIPYSVKAETPKEMTEADVWAVIKQFADAAERAQKAGFDSIDIHSAHGYLPAAFLSPQANQRTDRWGGDLGQRCAFLQETIAAIKQRVGRDFPVTIKISADEFSGAGLSLADTLQIIPLLEQAGIDAIQVSAGAPSDSNIIDSERPVTFMRTMPMGVQPGCLAELAAAVKNVATVPIIALGRLSDAATAERLIASGQADLVSLARQIITDPQWPELVHSGHEENIRPCISCNEGCYNQILSGHEVSCACNPEVGREYLHEVYPREAVRRVVVVGGGICGLQAADTAQQCGHQVILIEKSGRLGGQLWQAQAAPDRGEIKKITDYMIRRVQQADIDIRLNTEATKELLEELSPERLLIATGSEPLVPPALCVEAEVLTGHQILDQGLTLEGQRVLVIGGGLVGCEAADFLAQNGSRVTLVDLLPGIANDASGEDRQFFAIKFAKYGVEVSTATRVLRLTGKQARLETPQGQREEEFDAFVVAVGSRSVCLIPGLDLSGHPQQVTINGRSVDVLYGGDCQKVGKIKTAFSDGYHMAISI